MKNLFEGLANQNNATISSEHISESSASVRLSGRIKITKGVLSFFVNYWGDVYESDKYVEFVHLSDIDYDFTEAQLSGVRIDSMNSFKEGLKSMGLSSVSDLLDIKDHEVINEITLSVQESSLVKKLFNNKPIWEALPMGDRKSIVLENAIKNYDKANAWELNRYGLSESSNTLPSLQELITMKNLGINR